MYDSFFASQSVLFSFNGLCILTVTICVFIWHSWNRKHANSPPGSAGVPFLGVILSLRAFPERVLTKWSKIYGPLYMVKFGPSNVVVIGSPEVAYQAFAKHDCFNDRPQTVPVFDTWGIMMVNYAEHFKEQRRFSLHTLRDFGMGRRSLEPGLLETAEELCKKIDDLCAKNGNFNEPIDIIPMIYEGISSVIARMVFGHGITKKNKHFFDDFLQVLTEPRKTDILAGVMLFIPFLRFLPVFSYSWNNGIRLRKKVEEHIKQEIVVHQNTRDPQNPRDFIDCFLNELNKRSVYVSSGKISSEWNDSRSQSFVHSNQSDEICSDNWKPGSSFSLQQLTAAVRDIFMAGTDTTSSLITWIILFLCKNPDVQQKMQNEIDEVIGQNGVPSVSIIKKLPYFRAVIQEISRLRPTVPLSVPHMASRDATLMGYHIPKGAIILTNIWGIQNDESRWPEPEKFLPERHLDKDGNFIKSSDWMIFNVGHRSCLGQQLAKMELFLTTVALFRQFRLTLPKGVKCDINGESSVVLRPSRFKVLAARRY